jgi:hypothetical protein
MALIGSTQLVDIPHEPGNQVAIRPLSGHELDQAIKHKKFANAELEAAAKTSLTAKGESPTPTPSRTDTYDLDAVLLPGLQAFAGPLYLDSAAGPDTHHTVTPDLIKHKLDAPTRLSTFHSILDITPGALPNS